jgi:protein-S-isoprenylcysteine O-methyltransferase Ste14
MHSQKNMLDIFLKIIAIVIFVIRIVYWYTTEKTADKEKPKKQEKPPLRNTISEYINWGLQIFVASQLLGLQILPINLSEKQDVQLMGLAIMLIGLAICIIARKELSTNWTNGYEYQVKENHTLVTTGIYSLVRHPIYTGYALLFIGGEMVVGSWLFVSFLFFFVTSYIQGKREEKLLLSHFGKDYRHYMKRTKMLIPFVL